MTSFRFLLVAAAILAFPVVSPAQSGVIRSVAGNGTRGYAGDDGPAIESNLNVPSGVFVDEEGDLYLVDTGNNRVRRVADGRIETVAGTGERVSSGDEGPASAAGVSAPSALFVDGRGNTYVSEWNGHRIRKIDASGRITTVVGTGEHGYSGEGIPAKESRIWTPSSIFVTEDGSIYFTEWENHRVRRVSPNGNVTTLAGDSFEGFSGDGGPAVRARLRNPNGIFVDGEGRIYFSDLGNHRVRVIEDGIIRTVAGMGRAEYAGDGGPATEAAIDSPSGIFVDDGGNLYICDTRNGRIRRVDTDGIITTVAGGASPDNIGDGGPATFAALRSPASVFVDREGDLYIADASNYRIRVVSGVATPTVLPGTLPKSSDFDGSGRVGFRDFLDFMGHYGRVSGDPDFDARYDLLEDGEINFDDFLRFASAYLGG